MRLWGHPVVVVVHRRLIYATVVPFAPLADPDGDTLSRSRRSSRCSLEQHQVEGNDVTNLNFIHSESSTPAAYPTTHLDQLMLLSAVGDRVEEHQ